MADDIILDRSGDTTANIMKLDDNEQAFLNELEIKPRKQKPTMIKRRPRPVPVQDEEIEAFTNPVKSRVAPPPPPVFDSHSDEEDEYGAQEDYGGGDNFAPEPEKPSEGYTSIEEEKADLLNKLTRLEKKGFKVNKKLNIYSNIQELRTEV